MKFYVVHKDNMFYLHIRNLAFVYFLYEYMLIGFFLYFCGIQFDCIKSKMNL